MKPVVATLPSAPMRSTPSSNPRRTIGAILIDSGRLSPENAERVLRLQKESGRRFGQVALELGLVSQEDIRYALSHQFEYPSLGPADTSLSADLVAAYHPFSRSVEQLRVLRSQLMLRWFTAVERKPLAVIGPGHGAGASFIAANLAIVFSQLGEQTLLIDANLRSPHQHVLFKTGSGVGLSDVLVGHAGPDVAVRVPALANLSILPAGAVPPNPQELLGRGAFSQFLAHVAAQYDVVLLDTPAAVDYADAQIIAARAGGAILVARRNVTPISQLTLVAQQVQAAGAMLLGSVLNDDA